MSTIHSGSSIPELIKFIRYSFRESEFDQVQNILMEKEKIMLIEMEKLAKDRDSLKNEFYLLGNIRRVTVSEKCSLEGKLGGIKKRCKVLEKEISQLKEKIRIVRNEKLVVEKKLEKSLRKCEEREEKFAKMEKEIEDLRGDKLDANLAVEELKRKEIETNGIVLELKLKNAEANRTIDELRVKMMESESSLSNLRWKEIETDGIVQELKLKNVEANQTIHELRVKNMEFESSVCDVDPRILMLETKLAKICDVSVEDLRYLVSRTEDSAAAANVGDEENVENCPMNVDAGDRVAVLPEVRPTCGTSSGDGGIGFVKKGSKGGTVQLGGEVSSSATVDVVVIESDDEREAADAIVTNKRSRTERAEDWSVKKKPSLYLNDFEDVESTDSDDESCPDWDIDKLLQTIQSKGRCGK